MQDTHVLYIDTCSLFNVRTDYIDINDFSPCILVVWDAENLESTAGTSYSFQVCDLQKTQLFSALTHAMF